MIDEETAKRVGDRLAMVKHLIEANNPLAVPANAGPTKGNDGRHDGGWVYEYAQLDALVNYLLFTCFDVLGQRPDWVPFGTWLAAERYDRERQEVLAACSDAKPVAVARLLHDQYSKVYGARRAFMNFIDVILSPEAKRRLMDSVYLINVAPGREGEIVDGESKRKELLYGLRNEFTHGARLRGAPRMSDGSRLAPASSTDSDRGLLPGNHLFTEKGLICMVEDWPFRLYETVAGAIGESLPDFDVKYTVMLTLRSGRHVTIEKVPRSDLADPGRRRKLFADVEAAERKYLATNVDNEAP